MTALAPVLSFHPHALFDAYRQGLESVDSIGIDCVIVPITVTPTTVIPTKESIPIKETELEEMEMDEAEMDALIRLNESMWEDEDPEIKEKQEKHVAWLEQQQKESQQLQLKQDLFAKEYALIKQLEDGEKEPRLYDYTTEDIIETAAANCEWLLEKDINVQKMNNTNALLRKNLEYELLCQDKRSTKIVALHDRFTELALREDIRKGELTTLIAKTYKTTQDPKHDQLLLKCSEPKKRGRTSDADRLKIPNMVDALRKEYITPRKACPENANISPLAMALEAADTDKYKAFMATLKLFHDNALTDDNYGAYLDKMIKLIELKGIDWPMQSLMRSILNMEALLGITEMENITISKEEVYYCSYSGDRINHGDNVYLIRILEQSHERHKKWRVLKNKPNREFESPEFMESVRAFFVKKHFISLTGLWMRDFDESYKNQHDDYFKSTKRSKTSVITKKDCHLWQRMNYMRNFIYQNNLENRQIKGKSFGVEVDRIHSLLRIITDQTSLQTNLCEILEAYSNETYPLNSLMFLMLDFVDVLYTVNDGNLTCNDVDNTALRLILNLSYERSHHPSYDASRNEFEKINRELTDINQYHQFSDNHFLFLSLFDYFFPTEIKKEEAALEVLQLYGL